jgi:hypothetical protein
MLKDRDLIPRQDVEARGLFDGLIKIGLSLLGQVFRRDVTSDELLAARDGAEDLVNSTIGSRDSSPEQRMQDRDDGLAKLINALASRRDVAPDGLAARGNLDDLLKILNTRESGFKRDMQARGLLTSFLGWGLHKLMFSSHPPPRFDS